MDVVTRLNGTLVGRYTLERELGRGGMATVYLARDLRHQRLVAFKLLDPELGAVLGTERFLSEIRVTANLQHPNLLPLFDSGEAEGLLYYVMPYVEGESLRALLDREKQLPVGEAVRIATAIAAALDYAHRHGVVHRDLKPENILLQDGQPVVADFGIALAVQQAGGARITQTGLSLGTPQYMSPEQATGDRSVDGRADVYSLGAILYEMLAGDPPHTASTVQAVIAKVLTERAPNVRVARPSVPEHLAYAVERALEKLPADRWASAKELADALEGKTVAPTSAAPAAAHPRPRVPTVVPWAAFGLAAAAAAALWITRPKAAERDVVRFDLVSPGDAAPSSDPGATIAISPDGRTVAYTTLGSGLRQIYIRELGETHPRLVSGATNGYDISFSPDGRSIAYVSSGQLMVARIADGASSALASVDDSYGTAWRDDGSIIFTRNDPRHAGRTTLWRIGPGGGQPKQACAFNEATRERDHWLPYALPRRDVVLYTSVGLAGLTDLRLASCDLRTGATRLLGVAGLQIIGVADGQLLFVQQNGTLARVGFDARTLTLHGDPEVVLDSVRANVTNALAALSRTGTLVYVTGSVLSRPVLVAPGKTAVPLTEERRVLWHPRFSPDGRRLAFDIPGIRGTDIWIYDIAAKTFTRLTNVGNNDRPEWTPDGKRVLYLSDRGATKYQIWAQAADGSGAPEMLYSGPFTVREVVATPDGKALVFREDHSERRRDIFYLPLDGSQKPVPLLATEADELMPRLSSDGRWLAYQSDESGTVEVYVRPLPGPGGRVQVSTNGGREPLWARDGRLLYRHDRQVIAATLSPNTGGLPTVASRSVVLEGDYLIHPFHPNYDVAPNGDLLMMAPASQDSRVLVVTNWLTELRKRKD